MPTPPRDRTAEGRGGAVGRAWLLRSLSSARARTRWEVLETRCSVLLRESAERARVRLVPARCLLPPRCLVRLLAPGSTAPPPHASTTIAAHGSGATSALAVPLTLEQSQVASDGNTTFSESRARRHNSLNGGGQHKTKRGGPMGRRQ